MKPVFVMTQNVKAFAAVMEIVKRRIGHDSLAMVSGRAGRGKTRTAMQYATQFDCVYLTTLRDWTPYWLYQDVLTAMGIYDKNQPNRKKAAFELIVSLCRENPRPIMLDEADLLGPRLLESVRDLCKVSNVPWVLIGEESLPHLMNRDRRVWSRRCASMEFQPMGVADVVAFCEQATKNKTEDPGLKIRTEVADLVQRRTGGDVRLIEMILGQAETIARASQAKEVTEQIAQAAIKRDRKSVV